jgi:hypothetical protein
VKPPPDRPELIEFVQSRLPVLLLSLSYGRVNVPNDRSAVELESLLSFDPIHLVAARKPLHHEPLSSPPVSLYIGVNGIRECRIVRQCKGQHEEIKVAEIGFFEIDL